MNIHNICFLCYEVLLKSTHNICFHGEIKKISCQLFYLELCKLWHFHHIIWEIKMILVIKCINPCPAEPGYTLLKKPTDLNLHCLPFSITKTCLYNIDPLKPHFYIVKLGFTGVYIIFLISAQKHRLWYSLELPRRGGSNEYPQSMFWPEVWEISEFLSENFHFLVVKMFSIFE